MERELAEKLVEKLQEIGDDKAELYEEYSGRFMYGETTTGVEFSDFSKLLEAIYLIGVEDGDYMDYDFSSLRIDNLALNYIIY